MFSFLLATLLITAPSRSFHPGQTLVVGAVTGSRHSPVLIWKNKIVPFYASRQGSWRALTRVPLDETSGEKELEVESYIGESRKIIRQPFKIQIVSVQFGHETLHFGIEKALLLNDPSEDEESQVILGSLKTISKDRKQYWKGRFGRPVKGIISSRYGIKREKVGQKKADFHKGVDFIAALGEPIKAPNQGIVILVRDFKFHGKTVVLNHGQGLGSIYIHLNNILVKEGEKVKKGETLGEVGTTGLATAPHLHWGVYVHAEPVDPEQWLEEEF